MFKRFAVTVAHLANSLCLIVLSRCGQTRVPLRTQVVSPMVVGLPWDCLLAPARRGWARASSAPRRPVHPPDTRRCGVVQVDGVRFHGSGAMPLTVLSNMFKNDVLHTILIGYSIV